MADEVSPGSVDVREDETTVSSSPARPRSWLAPRVTWGALAVPGLIFLLVVFVYPLVRMVVRSFTDPSPENYAVLVQDPLYARVFVQTLTTSAIVTLTCLLLGYPFAYAMAASKPKMRTLLLLVVILPFWTSWLVRTFALITILQDTGLINDLLISLGVIDGPLTLIRTTAGVTIGVSNVLLPFMVLPLFAVMVKIDGQLLQAAQSLGATRTRAFWSVFVPLTIPGVVAGSFLVFVLSIGFYVTPALLGGPQDMMIGQLIATQFQVLLQFGQGSAVAVVLLVSVGLIVWLGSGFGPVVRAFRGEL
jgi:putative spermidine/putrescine transport system permease protein